MASDRKRRRRLRYDSHGWSVAFPENFALHSAGVCGRAFFWTRREAREFQRELRKHKMETRVVQVTVCMSEVPS